MSEAILPSGRSELLVRAIAGGLMALIAIAALVRGGNYFWTLVTVAALLMASEWARLTGAGRSRSALAMAIVAVPLVMTGPSLDFSDRDIWITLLGGALVASSLGGAWLGGGVLYAAAPALALLLVRDQSDGTELTLWTLAVVWATDIGAYFSGRAIGGPKLAPRISPNKTWAGLFGGMIAALAVGFALAALLRLPLRLGALGALLAAFAQAGDLFESWLKRRAGVKDSGRLLPGHGGALDRLDGVVPVACVVALLIVGGWI